MFEEVHRLERRIQELEAVLEDWVRYDEAYPDVLSGDPGIVPQALRDRMRRTRAALNLSARTKRKRLAGRYVRVPLQ